METRIESFLESQRVMSLCSSPDSKPRCASCFYTYMPEYRALVFKSDRKSNHVSGALSNKHVAGTILPDIHKPATIRGIQFTGDFLQPEGVLLDKAKQNYYKKYPIAIPVPGEIWMVELDYIKMTDNTLGFGKKLQWKREKTAV